MIGTLGGDKGKGLDGQITSFGTCNLTEDKCGDTLLLDKILLCFLEIQKRIELKPNNGGGGRTVIHPHNSNLSKGTFLGSESFM